MSLLLSVFFFSSRRRHTRWPRDWSSDVCSSDLGAFGRGSSIASGISAYFAVNEPVISVNLPCDRTSSTESANSLPYFWHSSILLRGSGFASPPQPIEKRDRKSGV